MIYVSKSYELRSTMTDMIIHEIYFPVCCQGRAGEIQDSILQNGYLDMLKLEVENNTEDVR